MLPRIVGPAGEVVISVRPVGVSAGGPGGGIEQLRGELRGRWRQAARAVMVLLSLRGLPPSRIAELPGCHPAAVRRWIGRFSGGGVPGLAGRPRSGRPRLGGRRLAGRVAALLGRPGPWTLPRIRRFLGWPQVSGRALCRRVRLVAVWRRPRLTARGGPDRDRVAAGIVARLAGLPRRAVVLAGDEARLNLLPHVRASWTLRGARPEVLTPGTNRKVTVPGAIEVTTGIWVCRLGRRCAADFTALLDQALRAFPGGPAGRHDLRRRQRPSRPRGHPLPGAASPAGAAGRRPVQPARQPGRADPGSAGELRGGRRGDLAGPPAADPLLLPRPVTRRDARYRRPLDQPLAAAGLRAQLLECRFRAYRRITWRFRRGRWHHASLL